jgi:hypothetical protein
MTKVMHAKVKRGRAIIKVRSTLGSKDKLNGSRGRRQGMKAIKDRFDIGEGEDRDIIDRHNIRTHKLMTERPNGTTNSRATDLRDKGTPEPRA